MRLTTIGTGTAAPSPTRVCAGYLVKTGDATLLLDCGSGVVHRMAALGIDWPAITHVLLTHFHADHISDLATLIVAWRHGILPPRSAPIELIGPIGTSALLGRLAAALWDALREPGFPVIVREIEPDGTLALTGATTISARKVPHTDESVAYSIEHGAQRIVYTGDTGFDAALGVWAAGCDLLLAECSLPSSMAIASHLTPEQCGALAALATPRLLVLTHFYPPVEQVDIAALVAERFGGPLALATDGWTIDIEDR